MRNMSKKTWKLRVWNHMTEMQKLDYLLTKAGITHEMEQFEINLAHICGMRYAVGALTGFLIYSRCAG